MFVAMTGPNAKPLLAFKSTAAWERWLEAHHTESAGIWLRFFKKGSRKASVAFDDAVDVAVCYGWIDGQGKSLDAESYMQKFRQQYS